MPVPDPQQDATFVDSGRFTLDPSRAGERLAVHQLPEPGMWAVKVLQGAVASQARELTYRAARGLVELRVLPDPKLDLRDLLHRILGDPPADRAGFHFLSALRSLLGQTQAVVERGATLNEDRLLTQARYQRAHYPVNPIRHLRWSSGGWCAEWIGGALRLERCEPGFCVQIGRAGRRRFWPYASEPPELHELTLRGVLSPLLITHSAKPLPRWSHGFEEAGSGICLAMQGATSLWNFVDLAVPEVVWVLDGAIVASSRLPWLGEATAASGAARCGIRRVEIASPDMLDLTQFALRSHDALLPRVKAEARPEALDLIDRYVQGAPASVGWKQVLINGRSMWKADGSTWGKALGSRVSPPLVRDALQALRGRVSL